MRSITILGATGSIGTQALKIAAMYPERFSVAALSARANHSLLFDQVRRFRPAMAALTGGEVDIPADLRFCEWRFGEGALAELARLAPADDVLVSVSGMVGLRAVLAAREAGRRVLLANKEALVAGGELVMRACADQADGPALIPVDSEHSAIYQCLKAANGNPFDRLILTASGGPFRTWPREVIRAATLQEALRHPNWSMGAKITVDSASMFNKALEIIEARWLFDAKAEQIEVLIHPQSIVHSLVRFEDGALLAQLGIPDMRVPILYAMSFPERLPSGLHPPDLAQLGQLNFEAPDPGRFPALRLAYEALRTGGTGACLLNAANEEAAASFIGGRISFGAITDIVEECLQRLPVTAADDLRQIEAADHAARQTARQLIAARAT